MSQIYVDNRKYG